MKPLNKTLKIQNWDRPEKKLREERTTIDRMPLFTTLLPSLLTRAASIEYDAVLANWADPWTWLRKQTLSSGGSVCATFLRRHPATCYSYRFLYLWRLSMSDEWQGDGNLCVCETSSISASATSDHFSQKGYTPTSPWASHPAKGGGRLGLLSNGSANTLALTRQRWGVVRHLNHISIAIT